MTLSLLLTGSVILLSSSSARPCAIRRCHPASIHCLGHCSLAKRALPTFPSMITKPLTYLQQCPCHHHVLWKALGQAQSGTPRSQGVGPFIDGRRCPFCLGACRTRPFHPRPGGCGKFPYWGRHFLYRRRIGLFHPSRSRLSLKYHTDSLLEIESGSNDPWPSC